MGADGVRLHPLRENKSSSSVGTLIGSLAGAAGFMFVGMISSIVTGDPNPSSMLVSLGLGVPALLIIILSSVTTNVMNLYSSAISFVNVFPKIEPWKIIVAAASRSPAWRSSLT